jgi:FMN phosphatase YigB (HAD superfamily)
VLFVGDHLENDAAAPALHGMQAALVRPRGLRPGEVLPDGTVLITHVRELPPLLQAA